MGEVLGNKMNIKTKNILTVIVLIAVAATIYAYAVMRAVSQ